MDVVLLRLIRPVVLLHGALVEHESLAAYARFLSPRGLIEHRTFPTIKNGAPIPTSARLVTETVGRLRFRAAREGPPQQELEGALADQASFESRLRSLEERLLGEYGRRVGLSRMDQIAPRVELVGHSAGGFVAYFLALEGELGVARVTTLASPLKEGLEPIPRALEELSVGVAKRHLLRPLGKGLPGRLAAWISEKTLPVATRLSNRMVSPLVYAARPGYQQVRGDSKFFASKVKGRQVPDAVSVISVAATGDTLVPPPRCGLQADNAHTVEVELPLSTEQLDSHLSRGAGIHVQLGRCPEFVFAELYRSLLGGRGLHPANEDMLRCSLIQKTRDREQLEKVADESEPLAARELARQRLKTPSGSS